MFVFLFLKSKPTLSFSQDTTNCIHKHKGCLSLDTLHGSHFALYVSVRLLHCCFAWKQETVNLEAHEQQNWTNKAQSTAARATQLAMQITIWQNNSYSRGTKTHRDIVRNVTSSLQRSHMAGVTEMPCVISDSLWPYKILIKSLFSKTPRQHHLIMRYFYIARKCESRHINNPQSESLHKLKCFVTISFSLKHTDKLYTVSASLSTLAFHLILQHVFFKSVSVDWGSDGLHIMHRYIYHILILLSSTSSVILKLQWHIRSCYSNIWSWFIDCTVKSHTYTQWSV